MAPVNRDHRVPRPNSAAVNFAGETQMAQNRPALPSKKSPWLCFGAGIVVALAFGVAIGFIVGHFAGKQADARERIETQARAAEALAQTSETNKQSLALKDQLTDAIATLEKEKGNSAASIKERDEKINAARLGEAEANAKLKAAESKLRATPANARDASAKQREQRLRNLERPQIQVVTAKEIETFGENLVRKRVQMTCTFDELFDIYAKHFGAEVYAGIQVHDIKNDNFFAVIVKKESFGKKLLDLKQGDSLCLVGTIVHEGRNYFFFAEEIHQK